MKRAMKKVGIFLLGLLIVVGIVVGYIQFRLIYAEKSVIEHLTQVKNIPESEIVYSEPFIANLSGDKNWMVAIKFKDDNKTYSYFESNKKIYLESYIENGNVEILYELQ